MQKEVIPARHIISIMTIFIFGSTVILGSNTANEQDSWVSLLMSMVIVIPLILIYARIKKLFPDMDLFDAVVDLFGNIGGKIITAFYILYSMYLGAAVLDNFSQFFALNHLPNTPQIVLVLVMGLVVTYLVRSGLGVLGQWSVTVFIILAFAVAFTIVAGYNAMNFTNILPIFAHDFGALAESAVSVFAWPFAEMVLFLGIISTVKEKESSYKIFLYSTLIGFMFILSIVLRNLFILGPILMSHSYFPSHKAARIISVGAFLTRLEGVVTTNFILGGITKIAVCLLFAGNGFAKLFNIEKRNSIIVPIGLTIVALSSYIYRDIIDMFRAFKTYWIIAFPFQVILPLLIWIFAEIKTRKKKNKVKENIYRHYKRLGSNE